MSLQRIPLFPLEVVLFPSAPLPLHIFEPRYKLMIGRCLNRRAEFGIVLARDEGIASVGCTAEIIKVVKKYDDGRMDILSLGREAFQVKELHRDEPYLAATIKLLEDDFSGISQEIRQKLLQTYERCYLLLHQLAASTPDRNPQALLAYEIASLLPLDPESKQALLELRSEAEREQRLLEQLEEWLPQLERMRHARSRAGGNGNAS